MSRLRVLFLLFPLFLLAQTPKAASTFATAPTSTPNLKSGQYSGSIFMYGSQKYYQPSDAALERHDFTIDVKVTIGKLQFSISPTGVISGISIDADVPFTYSETMKIIDDGSKCCCLGYETRAAGMGTLEGSRKPPALTPTSGTFSISTFTFSLSGLSASGEYFGPKSKCPSDVDTSHIRASLDKGFKSMFGTTMEFKTSVTWKNAYAGICELPAWAVDADHVFNCTWYVERVPKKK